MTPEIPISVRLVNLIQKGYTNSQALNFLRAGITVESLPSIMSKTVEPITNIEPTETESKVLMGPNAPGPSLIQWHSDPSVLQEQERAYREGYGSQMQGKSVLDCPYVEGQQYMATAWNAGYNDGATGGTPQVSLSFKKGICSVNKVYKVYGWPYDARNGSGVLVGTFNTHAEAEDAWRKVQDGPDPYYFGKIILPDGTIIRRSKSTNTVNKVREATVKYEPHPTQPSSLVWAAYDSDGDDLHMRRNSKEELVKLLQNQGYKVTNKRLRCVGKTKTGGSLWQRRI